VRIPVLVSAAVEQFAGELRRRFGDAVLDVRLFGSFARGEAHEDSDVDVAVVLESVDGSTQREVIDLAMDVGLPFELRLSPLVFDHATYQKWRRQERPLVMDIEGHEIPPLTAESRRESAAAELRLADEEIQVAEQLLYARHARIAQTRAYFALFRAIRGRLYSDGLEPRTRDDVQRLWNVHFVRPRLYEPATGRLLSKLQKFREDADYAPDYVVDEHGAREDVEAARDLVERIQRELGE
jgi:uncharacterized protein